MPVFTCILEFIIHGTVHPLGIYLSLIPVIIGTMLVCAGDVYGTFFGIALLVISCTVSSLKGIITKYLLSGKEPLSTFHLLNIVCSLSFVDTQNTMLAFPEALTLSLFNDRGFWSTWLPRYLSLSLCHLVLLFRQFCSFSCTECLLSH